MRRRLLAAAATLWFLSPHGAPAAEPVVPERVVKCAECGMSAKVANRYTSRLVQGGSTLHFCDIGDLAVFIERAHPQEFAAAVHDFATGEWVDVNKAFFVIDKRRFSTPMGWGVAAFRDREAVAGTPLAFELLRKALR